MAHQNQHDPSRRQAGGRDQRRDALDPNTITWQSVNRTVNKNALPDTPAIRMKRVK